MSKAKYVVVGANGYIGAKLSEAIPQGISFVQTATSESTDVCKLNLDVESDFQNISINKGDVVFLTAAISAPDICVHDYERAYSVNVTGTIKFIDYVINQGGRVIFFSSDTVYGESPHAVDESALCCPSGEYAAMKFEVETRFSGVNSFKSIRLSFVYSAEDKFSKYLESCVRHNQVAELYHPFYRAIVHRDDVITGVLKLAQSWNEYPEQIINFAGPQVLSRVDFAKCLKKVYLPDLNWKIVEPSDEFFTNRPRIISMKSKVFHRLLGRQAMNLSQAAIIEIPLSKLE